MIAPFAKLIIEFLSTKKVSMVEANVWYEILISICLLVVLLSYRPKLRKRSVNEIIIWLTIAVVVGICSGVLTGNILSIQVSERSPYHPTIPFILELLFIQLGNAAVIEEPLLRGFLWGFLLSKHWKVHWIWLIQAGLFMLAHIYYLGTFNYSLFIIVPFSGLVFGLLVWRSKSIGTSMIAHVNADLKMTENAGQK